MIAARFHAALLELGPFPPAPHFAVALSGGADSLALTLLAADWAAQGGRITALTVDHQLREGSTAETQQVAAMMQARGIAHRILTPAHDDVSNNVQEAARKWRYRALADYCRAHGILHCFVAQHAGDNRETVLHNQQRGETVDGLSGMRRVRTLDGVRFLRPLLSFERVELQHFLRERKVEWIDDPSNENPRFARVRLRRQLAQDAALVRELDAVMRTQAAARTARDEALAEAAVQCVTISPLGFAEIALDVWRRYAPALQSQLIADSITTISGRGSRPRAADTLRLVEALDQPFAKRTLQHCELSSDGVRLRIARELARVEAPLMLEGSGNAQWDGRFCIAWSLPKGNSYTIAAIGAPGRRHYRARGHDLPASTPGIWHLDELLHVPHIGLPHPIDRVIRIGFAPPKPLAAAPFW